MNLNLTRELARAVILSTNHMQWTLQGFGMMRYKLGSVGRLHIWNPLLAVPGVSTIHSHPWDLSSTILAGRLLNVRYIRDISDAETFGSHYVQELQTGEGGGLLGEPRLVKLYPKAIGEWYGPGDGYVQTRDEVHESIPDHGCVTLIERPQGPPDEKALTFWARARGPRGWVSAEPRQPSHDEYEATRKMALAAFGD